MTKNRTTPTQRAASDDSREVKLAEAYELLQTGVAELVTSEGWRSMLQTAATFHRYSLNNLLLIQAQRPDATRVAGYKTWQSLGRQVRKGEKGIKILAPCSYRPSPEDVDDGYPRDAQGRPVPRVRGFKVEHVWDVSQTDGEPLEAQDVTLLSGEAPEGLWDALAKQVAEAGYILSRERCSLGVNGYTDTVARRVVVREDVDDAQAVKTLAHELAHVLLGHGTPDCRSPRSQGEVEAESVAFVVTSYAGMDASGYSFPYVAGWAAPGKEVEAMAATAAKVLETARRITAGLEETA